MRKQLTSKNTPKICGESLSHIAAWTQHKWARGTLLFGWSEEGLCQVFWNRVFEGHDYRCNPENQILCWADTLQRCLDHFCPESWQDSLSVPVDLAALPAFTGQILDACRRIPFGSKETYGSLARSIGKVKGARGVGQAMARNPVPIFIPCHRVVGSNGALTGYSGDGGIDTKRWLLEQERTATAADSPSLLWTSAEQPFQSP